MSLFAPIFDGLNASGVRYVIVGGLATVLHGYARLTADIDLVVDLQPTEALKAIDALSTLGYRPRPPVNARDFANPTVREQWVRDKGVRVFSMYNPGNPMIEVDLFVEHAVEFEGLWERSKTVRLSEKTEVRVAGIDDLITLKQLAGRPQDLRDIEALEAIRAEREDDDNA